jgi:hypothetical protein
MTVLPERPCLIRPAIPLHDWFERTLQAAGARGVLHESGCSPEAMADVLELARRSTDSGGRSAAPLAAFAAGVALARAGGDLHDLKEIIHRIVMSMS